VSPVFAAEGFWKAFGRREVLRDASVWGEAGAVTVLFGRNGSGKSTLFRAALGFVRTDTGVVILGGARYSPPRLPVLAAHGLFFLPDRDLLARGFTLREHLDAVARRFPGADAGGAVDRLELGDLLDRLPHALSGGERRRAEIALIEARRPTVLVADEPLRGLAPLDASRVGARLKALAGGGCAVVVSGHESALLLELADQVVWMTGGTTHALGSAAAARAHHQFRQAYLGPRG
jgi:ABC-type multidrug transport system ATPase subunit